MPHKDLQQHFDRIDRLVGEMNDFVPITARGVSNFRADLAGMLVVAIAAMYESCVKETMIGFAAKHDSAFERFTSKNFEKLSSRITLGDLHRYANTFDPSVGTKFKNLMNRRKSLFLRSTGRNIQSDFEAILSWRHEFAHAGIRNTTIEEAARTHRLGRVVVLNFHDAFS